MVPSPLVPGSASAPLVQPNLHSHHEEPRVSSSDIDRIIEVILILTFPPLALWYHAKQCNCQICLNTVLLILFVIPSVLHAFWYCFIRDGKRYNS
ncbi:hypothetical protein AB6A40_000364 [Gnathostoma spinigerum]|uniref:Uncharacterized protein n=1 Tax=Gnathostoma spinigerum TaxID=75299 RepID=A0ABD6E1Z5_9BILA